MSVLSSLLARFRQNEDGGRDGNHAAADVLGLSGDVFDL